MAEVKSLAHLVVSPAPRSIVQVFVRKGAYEGQRVLSFTLPRGLRSAEIIQRGFAIDGNRAIAVIHWHTTVTDHEITTPEWSHDKNTPPPDSAVLYKFHPQVLQVLHDAERMLVTWLTDLGYEVEFK